MFLGQSQRISKPSNLNFPLKRQQTQIIQLCSTIINQQKNQLNLYLKSTMIHYNQLYSTVLNQEPRSPSLFGAFQEFWTTDAWNVGAGDPGCEDGTRFLGNGFGII